MHVAIRECLHWKRIFKKKKFKKAVNDSDTCDLGTMSWSANLVRIGRPLVRYNRARFERPPLNSVHAKANDKVFVKSGNTSIIFLEYMQK